MSILRKRGQRALTKHQQKRATRHIVVRGKWKRYYQHQQRQGANTRSELEKAFKGVCGRVPANELAHAHFLRTMR